jgi:phosphosulfolactate synthase (CoM biosynthesis protein A)
MKKGTTIQKRMIEEEKVREKIDKYGRKWIKVYFGGGAHFQNWLNQFIELKGEDNIQIEEIDSTGFKCFEDSGEKMYRIWSRE